jgi:hypothetical protein
VPCNGGRGRFTKAAALSTFALIWLTLEVMPFQDAKVLSEFTTVRSNSDDPGLPAAQAAKFDVYATFSIDNGAIFAPMLA